jgi:hypothetical protein
MKFYNEKAEAVYLDVEFGNSIFEARTSLVTTETLGVTIVSEAVFENADGTAQDACGGNVRGQNRCVPPDIGGLGVRILI